MSQNQVDQTQLDSVEYVLGLLDRNERVAVERELLDDADLAAEVWDWEERFAPLAEALPTQRPPSASYAKLSTRLFGEGGAQPKKRSNLARDMAYLFGTLATGAVAALLIVLVQLPGPSPSAPAPSAPLFSAALVEADGSVTLAVIDRDGQMAVQPLSLRPEGSAELWLVAEDRAPISLGLIDGTDANRLPIDEELRPLLRSARFVVTAEPVGGLPEGGTAGPAIAQGDVIEF